MFFAVPTIYGQLLERAPASAFQSVRYFFSAADTLPARVARAWQEKFSIPIHEGYGLSESTPFACYNHELSYRLGSIGAPIEQVEMRIADPENGHELPAGETGEILIRGPNVMLGYWNRPQETADTVRDGWLRTGDLGSMDGDGYFYIVDRLKDMINVGGLKAFPAEVEQALCQYPGVSEAAVFGVPDPISGERVCARVVLQPEASVTAEALRAHCRQRVADFKVPAEIGFVKSLPKTGSGKVLRRELRAAAAVREQEASKLTQQSAGLAR
jgi:long-chain acyl-CoA synthetase